MNYPLVSILIANYNNARYIVEALESAVGQTYPNIEIVMADDGSTDDSVRIVEGFIKTHPETRIVFFKNSDNQGCGRVKRQCIEKSEGEYFCFLDPDDTISAEAVATLMEAFGNHPEGSIVYGTHYLCNEALESQGVSNYPGLIPEGQSHLTSTGGHISALAICSRQIYDGTSGINASYLVAEDQDLYLKMEECAPVFYVGKPLYFYRKHDHNSSWNEHIQAKNIYYRHRARAAAYRRRKRSTVPNLTMIQFHKECLACHLQLRHHYHGQGQYLKALWQIVLAFPYLYTWFADAKK